MSHLEVVIIDDEPVATRRLLALLRNVSGVVVAGTASNVDEGLAKVEELDPDLALIDVEMPGLNGVNLASRLRSRPNPPAVVFVTAFSRFAVEAFGLQATDYLLKPVEFPRLVEAIERVRSQREQARSTATVAELKEIIGRLRAVELEHCNTNEVIWLATGGGADRVSIAEIKWVEAERDYVRVHTSRRIYFVRGRLGDFEARLGPSGMVRVHRSALVRATSVSRIEGNREQGFRLVLDDGTIVEASRRFGPRVRGLVATSSELTRKSK